MELLKRRVLGVDDRAVRADSPEDYYAAATSRAKTRTSPTGRVPRWVLDEAAGRHIPPVPFRGPTIIPAGPSSNFGIKARNITIFLAVAAVSVSGYLLGAPAPSAQGLLAGRETVAAAPRRQGPPPGREEAPAPRGAAPPSPAAAEGTGFRFMRHQGRPATPITWSPCRPIHYVTRPDNAPPDGAEALATAITAVGQATGLRFINDGATTEGPTEDRQPYQPARYGDRWAPVLIAWATPGEVPDFGTDITGEAGPIGLGTPSGDSTYISGTLYLDAQKMTALGATSNGLSAEQVVVLHELGHLVGLAHIDDPSQVMYPRSDGRLSGYNQGDRTGLAALGHGPCQPDI